MLPAAAAFPSPLPTPPLSHRLPPPGLLPLPNPSGPRLADPSSAPSGSGPGAVGTGQAGRIVPRGGRGAAGAGRSPAPPAGGAATLSRAATGGRGLQKPAGGETGGGACGGRGAGRGREAGPAGDRVGQDGGRIWAWRREGDVKWIEQSRPGEMGEVVSGGKALWRMGRLEGRGGGRR